MRLQYPLYFTLILLLISCNIRREKFFIVNNEMPNAKLVDIRIPSIDSSFFDYRSYLRDIKFIKFEKTSKSKFSRIDKIFFSENRIIIFDKIIMGSVFIFDSTGKFINKITPGILNNTPKKIQNIFDVCLYYDKQEILVYDYKASAIFHFDLSGKYITTTFPEFRFYSFANIRGTNVLIYRDLKNRAQIRQLRDIDIFLNNGSDSIYIFPSTQQRIKIKDPYFSANALSSYNSKDVFYTPTFSDTVFSVDGIKMTIYPKLFLHFSGPNIISTILENNNITSDQYHTLSNTGKYNVFDGVVLNNDDSAFFIQCKMRNLICGYFYSEKSKKIIGGKILSRFSSRDTNYVESYQYPIATTNKGEFVSIMPIENCSPNNVVLRSKKLNSVIKEYRKDDNPILVVYKINAF